MIVYLHGFSSGAKSKKAAKLKRLLAPISVIVPGYPAHRPRESIAELIKVVSQYVTSDQADKLVLVGSSLGGYYARYLGIHLDLIDGVVMINPALQPQSTLEPYIGQQTNMVTGKTFEFTSQDFAELAQFNISTNDIEGPTLVLLDEGDEIIDYQYAAHCYSKKGRVIIYTGGSHGFDHLSDAVPEIRAFCQSLAKQDSTRSGMSR